MIGPRLSIVISPGAAAQRLGLSVASAVAAGEATGAPFEVVLGLAGADAPTREAAEALEHPRLRLSLACADDTQAAAALAWGEVVVLMKGGDLLTVQSVARLVKTLDQADGETIARPAVCMTYGGSPSMRTQTSLVGAASDRARLVFGAPFAPPLAAPRALLVRLPARVWSEAADWAWTAGSVANGVRHEVAGGAVHVAWSPPVVAPVALPPAPGPVARSPSPQSSPIVKAASEAETAAVLYARAAHSRLSGVEASSRANAHRLEQLAGEAERFQAALATARDDADQAHRAVKGLRASTSWKVTAPLRALAALVKPGRR